MEGFYQEDMQIIEEEVYNSIFCMHSEIIERIQNLSPESKNKLIGKAIMTFSYMSYRLLNKYFVKWHYSSKS